MDGNLPDDVLRWGLRILYAAAIFGIGLWIAFFVSRLVRNQAAKNPRIDQTLGVLLSRVILYAIVVVVLIAVLQMFGVQTASLVAVLGAGALAIGLALQGTLGNVASGIIIALMRPYHLGDFVEINGREGVVTDLDLFFTEIMTLDDRRILVPNGPAVTNPIVNFSIRGLRRCVIVVGVSYEDDIDKAIAAMRDVMAGDARAASDPPPWFGVDALADSSINISGRAWIKTADYLDYRADMLKEIKEAFDREEIEMPYPHAVELSKGEIAPRSPPIKPPASKQRQDRPPSSLALAPPEIP